MCLFLGTKANLNFHNVRNIRVLYKVRNLESVTSNTPCPINCPVQHTNWATSETWKTYFDVSCCQKSLQRGEKRVFWTTSNFVSFLFSKFTVMSKFSCLLFLDSDKNSKISVRDTVKKQLMSKKIFPNFVVKRRKSLTIQISHLVQTKLQTNWALNSKTKFLRLSTTKTYMWFSLDQA